MAAIESPEKLGLMPFDEFTEANRTWPRGDRPAAIREAASELRARFATPENRIRGVRTVDIPSVRYPVEFPFGGPPEDVDFISFDHRHVQDVRFVLGTSDPPPGHDAPLPPLFPNAKLLTQRKEWDTFRSLHPVQWAWYVEDGIKGVPEENVALLEGDVELGKGVALIATPGHTDGNHSLCINTLDGVWVSSENGVCADSWHPHLSKIPGVRKFAEFFGREVVLNSNTLEDSIDQYDSMLKEKALADPNRRDPRYLNVFPSSEMADWKRQWPVVPTFWYGGINYGTIERR